MRQVVGYLVLVLIASLLALGLLREPVGTSAGLAGAGNLSRTQETVSIPRSVLGATAESPASQGAMEEGDVEALPAASAIAEGAGERTGERTAGETQRADMPGSTLPPSGGMTEENPEENGSGEANRSDVNGSGDDGYIPWIGVVPAPPGSSGDTNDSWTDREDLFSLIEKIGGEMGDPVFLRIFKTERRLEVWMEVDGIYRFLTRYSLCYYPGVIGPKRSEDDDQVPEGFYRITAESLSPSDNRYRSIAIDYPNTYDRVHDWSGSGVTLYGSCSAAIGYGLDPGAMEEVYELVDTAISNGQSRVSLHLYPFYLSPERMEEHEGEEWYDFWENLKEGFDIFNRTRQVPWVWVEDGRYVFGLR